MAVDSNLISGAYRANRPTGVAEADIAKRTTKSITGSLNQYMQVEKAKYTKISNEFENYAQGVLDNSDLKGEEFSALYDDLMVNKSSYINADKRGRAMQIRDLNVLAQDYSSYKSLREDVAINIDSISPRFSNSIEGKKLIEVLSGDGKNLKPKDGKLGIEVDGEFMSINELKKYIKENTVDQGSRDALESFNIKVANNAYYNTKTTKALVQQQLISKGNLKSLAYDEMIPGRNFNIDLIESLVKKTYGQLGVDDSYFEGIQGVDASNGIDYEEAETIAYSLINDEALLKETLTDYYTTYINKQHRNANPTEETDEEFVSRLQANTLNNQPKVTETTNETTLKGGTTNSDNEFVPEDDKLKETNRQQLNQVRSIRSNMMKAYDQESVSNEEIIDYIEYMERKDDVIASDIYKPINLNQYLKKNLNKSLKPKK